MKKVWHHSVRVGLLVAVVLALTLVFVMSASTQEPDEEAESRTQPAEIRSANLTDPPPEGFQSLYIFTGLTNDNTGSDMIATVLHCTNIASSLTAVEVQLFDVTSTDVYTSRVTMSSGRTWTWATQNPPIYVVDTIMSTELIQSGSGRIVANTPEVICVAQVVDPVNTVPTFLTDLPLIDVRTQALFLPSISKE